MLNRPVPYIALILFIQGAIILYRTRNSYFFFDDFFAFMIFKETGMTWEYLSRNVFQEWIPGYCFSMGLFYRLFGLSFSAARSIILSLSLLSTIFVFLISSRMKVTLWLSITCLIVYVFLIQLFHTQVWWSDSIRVLPALVATLGCLYVLIGPTGSGPTQSGPVVAGLIFCIGLLFFAKVLFSIIIFGGVLIFVRFNQSNNFLDAGRRAIDDLRYVTLVAAVYSVMIYRLGIQAPKVYPSMQKVFEFIALSFFDGTLAGTFGLGTYAAWVGFWPSMIFSFVTFLGIVAVSVRINGGAVGVLWGAFCVYVLVAMSVIGMERALVDNAALWPRYNIEQATFLLLMTMLSLREVTAPRALRVGSIIIATLIGLNSELARKNIPPHWNIEGVQLYVANLTDSLKRLDAEPTLLIEDGVVPELIIPKALAPYNEIKRFLPLFTSKTIVIADEAHAQFMLTNDGSITPITKQ